MKTILLTGGTGFIGRNIMESYLAKQYTIVAPTRQELDMVDTDSVDAFFLNNTFDVVLHCATKPGHRNAKDRNNLLYTNTRMFLNLERNKDSYTKLINFGSGAVYDISTNITNATEETIGKNIGKDDHSFCKYVVHKYIEKMDRCVDLNIFGIYGKYEDASIRFISNAICKALYTMPITLRQNRRFSYIYVEDIFPIIEFFIENDAIHKSYNIVPDSYVELADIAHIVKEVSGKDIPIHIASEGYGLDYYGSNRRISLEFKDIQFTNLKNSVITLYSYYQSIQEKINYQDLLEDK